jgi:hypothetical protein
VGNAATTLFAIGLMGASLLAGAVLPLATAYAVSEVFGMPKGVSLDFRRAPIFFGLFTGLIVVGMGLSLFPGLPVIEWLVTVQVLNGVLLPIMLVFILRLINDQHLMGELKNTRIYNLLGWGTFILITGAVVVMLSSQILPALSHSLPKILRRQILTIVSASLLRKTYRNRSRRAFAHRRSDLFGAAMTHIAGGKNPGDAAFKRKRLHGQHLFAMKDVMAGHHKAILIQLCVILEERDIWQLTDKNERRSRM